ncbi:hypothetical protein [Methanoculleus sp. 7T]|uniref:hypothetical protein n=1 Tax=Methanoculleus sp. 7T TaxID=2937282 RepID=UPI0020C0F711|nr:hypothetical protein [Methanoculleus sp. 7T]
MLFLSDGIRFIVSCADRVVVNRMLDRTVTLVGISLLIALAAVPVASAVTAYPGSEIVLAGTSTGSDTIYLFVTGPNLPPGGGRLEDPDTPVRSGDPESFTTVTVDADNRWTYRWRTGETGLDPGIYTVYAVDAPVDRSNLSGRSYTTIPVTLGTPPGTRAPETAAPPTATPTAVETPTMTPTATPSPTPTAAAPAAAVLAATGVVLAAALLLRRR